MITTSVSLPIAVAGHWRSHSGQVMRCACRTLRLALRTGSIRRGCARGYNRQEGGFEIVTTRFTEAEYDTLHYVASAMRISVSLLVYWMIKLWLKPARRNRVNPFLTNYEYFPVNWGPNAGIMSEVLIFYRKFSEPPYFLIPRQ